MPRDPFCGMEVEARQAARVRLGSKEYFFCSAQCRDKFLSQQSSGAAGVSCHPQAGAWYLKNKLVWVSGALLLVVLASAAFPLLLPFRLALFGYLRVIWWAVLLGLFLGGVIDYYIPREYISQALSRRSPATILKAVFLGFLMSACSHGILALSIQLHKKGASHPAVVAFLLASPWANMPVTLMLFGFFGVKALFIILGAFIVAINTGLIYLLLEKKGLIEKNKNTVEVEDSFSIFADLKRCSRDYRLNLNNLLSGIKGVFRGAAALADMVLWWILLGVFFASLAAAYIPTHFFQRFMGPSFLGLCITLIVATAIEVCSEGSSPLAFEIYNRTHALGNSFAFLLAGVATDYTEIGLLWINLGRRTAIWLPVVAVPQIIFIAYLFNLFLR